jgi:hypothetical protein
MPPRAGWAVLMRVRQVDETDKLAVLQLPPNGKAGHCCSEWEGTFFRTTDVLVRRKYDPARRDGEAFASALTRVSEVTTLTT